MTIRPSLAFSAMRAMEGRFNAQVTHRRQTMEPVGHLSLARWHTRPMIGTDRPTKGFQTAPKPSWANIASTSALASRSCSPAASNFRSPKSARAAQECTALVVAIIAVTAMTISLTGSTRRVRSHHHDGSKGVKIKVKLLAVRVMFNGDYACNRLYVSNLYAHCARV